ncbi:MAG: flagellar brake protein [Halodesulfovibrio sp.]
MQQAVASRTRNTGMKLDIQLGTKMLMSLNGSEGKHGTELIGLNPYEYLILKMPLVPGIRNRMMPGEGLTIRYMFQGTIIGFKTHVINHISKPSSLVFVEFPDTLEQYELRSDKRLKCIIPTEVHSAHGVHKAAIVDLSAGGCKICFEVKSSDAVRKLDSEEMLVIKSSLFTGEDEMLSCVCRNVEIDKSTMTVGAAFSDLDPGVSRRLKEYIETVSTFL